MVKLSTCGTGKQSIVAEAGEFHLLMEQQWQDRSIIIVYNKQVFTLANGFLRLTWAGWLVNWLKITLLILNISTIWTGWLFIEIWYITLFNQ